MKKILRRDVLRVVRCQVLAAHCIAEERLEPARLWICALQEKGDPNGRESGTSLGKS
jgi:hypothetical protein